MPSDPQRVQAIFLEAVQKPESERAEFLERECGGDSELRRRVEALIAAHDQSGSFLDSPPKDLAGTSPTVAHCMPEQAGSLIGPFKLLQQIGEGGMGAVFMAEQIEPVERRVALKIIKPGMDTKAVIARFEAERQALAMMDHPNIAKVLDVGTTNSGRPYFVMELVRGVPITQYCDEHQLTPRERLELFLPVCQAVQHAHQKGIIHRDIKPSNVLVAEYDDRAVPKIIDFGLAKAMEKRLTAKTMFTEFGQIVGTPDYMSPEQAKLNQMDIDTRSDIYSLGVLLYELLSGNTPFDRGRLRSAAFDELLRIIREEEPPKPSLRLSSSDTLPSIAANRHITPAELTRQLSGELDWIVMKSLEKDRSRRYETANGLANDLRRYLNDDPVEACPPSKRYLIRKFAKRNKSVITVVVTMMAAILLGSGISVWQAILASQQATRANVAEQLSQQRFLEEQQARKESERSRREAQKNLQTANAERQRAESNLQLAVEALDEVYLKGIGEQKLLSGQRQSDEPFELTPLETELLESALTFYSQLATQNPINPEIRFQTAKACVRTGTIQAALHGGPSTQVSVVGTRQVEEAGQSFCKAITHLERLTEDNPPNAAYFELLGDAFLGYGNLTVWKPDAEEQFTKALDAYNRGIEIEPNDADVIWKRSIVHHLLRQNEERLKDCLRALEIEPKNAYRQMHVAGGFRLEFGSALTDSSRAVEHAQEACRLEPNNARYHAVLGGCYLSHGEIELALKACDRAIELDPSLDRGYIFRSLAFNRSGEFQKALDDAERAIELRPYFWSYRRRAEALQSLNRLEEALDAMNLAIDDSSLDTVSYRCRASILFDLKNYREAIDDLDKAAELGPGWQPIFHLRGKCHRAMNEFDKAIADFTTAIELAPNADAFRMRGECHRAMKEFDNAIADYTSAIELAPNADAFRYRGELYVETGNHAAAIEDFDRCLELMPHWAHVFKRRGWVHFRMGQYEDTLRDLRDAVRLNPADTGTIAWIGTEPIALCEDANFRSGIMSLADQLVEANEGGVHALARRSRLQLALGNPEAAFEDLKSVLQRYEEDSKNAPQATPSFDECYQRYSAALLCLQMGDHKKYRDSLESMQKRFATAEDSNSQNFVAWTACLAPNAVDDYRVVLNLAKKAVADDPENDQFQKTLAGLRFRAGEHDAARELLLKIVQRDEYSDAKANSSPAYGWYFLAMTHQTLGNTEEAKRFLAKANDWTNSILSDEKSPPAWNRKVTLELLRDEATEVISHAVDDQPIGVEATSAAAK